MTERETVKAIREIVKKAGYSAYWVYNDKNKNGRRLKFMQNGFYHPQKQYAKWDKSIKSALTKQGIVVKKAGWEERERAGYGSYMAYIVRL